jgi:hypothetical protein
VPIIKPAQRHKCNTETVQIQKNKTLKRQNKNSIAEKCNIKEYWGKNPVP